MTELTVITDVLVVGHPGYDSFTAGYARRLADQGGYVVRHLATDRLYPDPPPYLKPESFMAMAGEMIHSGEFQALVVDNPAGRPTVNQGFRGYVGMAELLALKTAADAGLPRFLSQEAPTRYFNSDPPPGSRVDDIAFWITSLGVVPLCGKYKLKDPARGDR